MKMNYYGPVSYPKIIRSVYTNIYNDPSLKAGYLVRINANNSSGVFKAEDLVYQGNSYRTATAYGTVISYNADYDKLILGATQGTFKTNSTIHAVSTNGVCRIESFDTNPLKLAEINIQPDPTNAEPTDDYGYDITITEWPDTEA